MRYIPPPKDENAQPLSAGDVFEICVSKVKNHALRAKLRSVRPDVEVAAVDYDTKAAAKGLYKMNVHNQVGTVLRDEMVKVYTHRMVPKRSTGRHIYDQIMSAPAHSRCPLCGIGTVNTLDHYLPKSFFPVFSVTPNNLIPACTWCQRAKREYYPASKGEQLLHPYFDDLDHDIWLAAEVVVGAPAGFRYFALPPDYWKPSTKARVAAHLKELKLPNLFSSNAGSRLSEIRARLEMLYLKGGGANAVKAHLNEELDSIETDHRNSWVAAMYRAAVASDWFCNGGFLQT